MAAPASNGKRSDPKTAIAEKATATTTPRRARGLNSKDSEENIVGGDNNENGWIETTVLLKSCGFAKSGNHNRKEYSRYERNQPNLLSYSDA